MIRNPPQLRIDGEIVSASTESEYTARRMNQFGFVLNGLGQGTSYNPSNPGFLSHNPVLDPVIFETEVTPKNALTRARELEAARLMLEQQRKEIEAEKERILATQRRLDEQESRLRQSMNVTEDRPDGVTRTYQGRHQSRFPLRGEF